VIHNPGEEAAMIASQTATTGRDLRAILLADAAVELACGAALLAFAAQFEAWFGLPSVVVYGLAAVFLLAAAYPAWLAMGKTSPAPISTLAWANVAGGTVGWLAFPFLWGYFEPEGRWVFAAVCDTFIALGVAELLALRRARPA
jgi:hypothetical protein